MFSRVGQRARNAKPRRLPGLCTGVRSESPLMNHRESQNSQCDRAENRGSPVDERAILRAIPIPVIVPALEPLAEVVAVIGLRYVGSGVPETPGVEVQSALKICRVPFVAVDRAVAVPLFVSLIDRLTQDIRTIVTG